ncbi:MAG: preprotein translocase subunit SecA [Candidatus Omnitrophica bacterium]|nr:preprotein translocase subunit SecA [Candidatus Omnitrophota bacterium]
MFKNFFLKKYQNKINFLNPKVSILLNKEIPTPSLQQIANLSLIVSKVNSFEDEIKNKPPSFFKEKTFEYKNIIATKFKDVDDKEQIDKFLDEILPFYFALVREAARRTIKMRHFDVQILGGIVLHKNKIAEMVTGEGKTLVATLAASLNALVGKGVHIVTVNDYLAKRDREWMGPVYEFLGLSCGVIQQDMDKYERRQAYSCDITYGTNSEFGFDYLRDNMATSIEELVQHGHYYAIVDEVDSILIDEARTPLIISGPAEVSTTKYYQAEKAIRELKVKLIIQSFEDKEGNITLKNTDGTQTKISPEYLEENFDAIVEEKTHQSYFTERGQKKCQQLLGIKSLEEMPDNFSNPWLHYLTNALRANYLFKKDKDYIVKDGKVIIVDEFTGRLMPGRRWSDGLHQAIEAKESLKIQEETQTLATITLQNYFKMYKKLAGMTGTAYTEANEFKHIYELDVVVIPTNRPLIRISHPDRIYRTKKGKFNAVVKEIQELYSIKRPVLVGTTSIDDSEELSFLLEKKGIPHNVLNAKYHEKEAYIIAQAGRLGQVTIATNMAGRGTDIILGGNIDYFIKEILKKNNIKPQDPNYFEEYNKLYERYKIQFEQEHQKVVELGGLHIIGTQRHEARRIDYQLRGRAGRQGDPGSSRFYVSLEDDLMRLFGSERIYFLMERFGFSEDQPIEHMLINRSLEIAQKRVEAHNFEVRKQLLEFDNVLNKQREVIYNQRREILYSQNIKDYILEIAYDVLEKNLPLYFEEEKNILGLVYWAKSKFDIEISSKQLNNLNMEDALSFLKEKICLSYDEKEKLIGCEQLRALEKMVALSVIDSRWKEHLLIIDSLKEGIYLRGYAHMEPLVEYQKEAYFEFEKMVESIKEGIVDFIFKIKPTFSEIVTDVFEHTPKVFVKSEYTPLKEKKAISQNISSGKNEPPKQKILDKVGRNDPCPCGSGKKYKKCCGK